MALLLILVATAGTRGGVLPGCQVDASHRVTSFCYRTAVSVASTTSTITNYPVEVRINGIQMVTGRLLGARGQDFVPVDPSAQELSGMIQDIETGDTTPTTWWLVAPSLTGSGTTRLQMYTGDRQTFRNQGIWFSTSCQSLAEPCDDTVTVPTAAALGPTDNLDVIATIYAPDPDQAGGIVDKFGGTGGYELTVGATSTGVISARVGNGTTTTEITTAWTGAEQRVRLRFDAGATNDLTLSFYNTSTRVWVEQAATDSGYTALGTTTAAFIVGESFDGIISEVELRDNVGAGTYGKVLHLGFNPQDLTETQRGTAGNSWVYTGNVTDLMGNHNGTYRFVRDQSFLTTTVGPTAFTAASVVVSVGDSTANVLGALGSGDFAATSTAYLSLGIFGDALDRAATGSSLSHNAFMFMITLIIATGVGGLLYFTTDRNEFILVLVMIVIFGLAAGVGVIPRWWAVIPGFVMFTAWILVRRPGPTA